MSGRVYPHHNPPSTCFSSGKPVFTPGACTTIVKVAGAGYCSFIRFDADEPGFICNRPRTNGNFCRRHHLFAQERRAFAALQTEPWLDGATTAAKLAPSGTPRNSPPTSPSNSGFETSEPVHHLFVPCKAPPVPVAKPSAFSAPAPVLDTVQSATVVKLREAQKRMLEQEERFARVQSSPPPQQPQQQQQQQQQRQSLPPLRTADFAQATAAGGEACGVCETRRINALVKPCNHAVCMFCVHECHERGAAECPMCRAPASSTVRL